MIPFRTAHGAAFACQVDPSWTYYANLNFHSTGPDSIAFHLSLRLADGLAVVNRKDASGWHREQHLPFAFPRHPFGVELDFGTGGVILRLAGQPMGTFSARPRLDRRARFFLRHGFPDLHRITFCTVEGAVPWETIRTRDRSFDRLWDAVQPGRGVMLTDRLELAEHLPPGKTTARHAVLFPGAAPVPLHPATSALAALPNTFALPPGIGAALLPGRIWLAAGPDAPAQVPLIDLASGQPCPPVLIQRSDLVQRLERLAASGSLAHDDLAALQAVEHARYAAIWPKLSPAAQAALIAAAARFGLTAFLAPDGGTAPLPAPVPRPPTPSPLAPLLADLSRLIRGQPDRAALADWLHRALPGPQDHPDTEGLALSLCPTFCEQDAFDLLHAAIAPRGLPPVRASDDVGYVSLRLPFQLMDGEHDQVINRLHLLATRDGGWLATSALGWIASHLANPGLGAVPPAKRHAILHAFCAVVQAQAENPWGRAPCHCLMDGVLALVANLPRLPPDLRQTVTRTALAAYGLSPRFWGLLAQRADHADLRATAPDLVTGARAFAVLTAPATRAAALSTLAALGCTGAPSAALCLLPPETAQQDAPWHRDLGLRALFRPGATAAPDIDVRAAIHANLPRFGRVARPSPFAQLTRKLGEVAFRLISLWPDTAAPERLAALQDCLHDASALSTPEAGHIGQAVLHALSHALAADAQAAALIAAQIATLDRAGQIDSAAPAPRITRAGLTDSTPRDAASALFNTVVVVMSCQPNLTTRIPALRRTWLADLVRLGIPYIVVVGGAVPDAGPDVVCLNAPDDYEGLPQKSLAAIAHVAAHFPGRRMLKVDDDCFLDAEEYFFSLSFLRADYYGRPLARGRGQMDRTWHMGKSASARGRHDLDKSPEPSTYADGGSGYLLSPDAIRAILSGAASVAGQRLIAASFMEDKLVGDLLALSGIGLNGQDYSVHVLRRARPGGLLVPKWENACLPFAGSGVKLAHLDGHELQDLAARTARGTRPATAKIWSTLSPARLGVQSQALDLISPPARLDAAQRAPVAVVACLRNEMFMLPHFLAHYRALGVDSFLIADNGSDDGTLEYLADQPDVALFSVESDYNQSHYGVLWQQALLAAYRVGRWSLVADADELLTWTADATGDLPALLRAPEFAAADAARVFMLDLYPQGDLASTTFADLPPFQAAPFTDRAGLLTTSLGRGPFSDAPTWTSATRHRLLPGSRAELFVAQKIALLRYQPWMRLSDGLHYVAETRLAPRALLFGHFKYNAAFRAKALTEVARGQHFNNAEEYRKYLDLISEGRGVIFDPAVSVHWTDSPFVASVLASGQPPA